MKKWLWVVIGIVSFLSPFTIYADSDKNSKQNCTQTGTWYGGSYVPEHEGYKYQYTFIPIETEGHYSVTADGVYNPDTLGAEVATTWTGQMVKKHGRHGGKAKDNSAYEIRLIALTSTDPVDPPEVLPMIWAVKGDVRFDGCDTLIIEYDWFAIHTWDKVPFVDEPDVWLLYDGQKIVETIKRMPMKSKLPTPPPAP